ncbi:hypothetical protein ENBRE01_1798 [Enteropsectra breve]|nr:hypothetical protein ENBRE01_1798 [Enteropsectra breve]
MNKSSKDSANFEEMIKWEYDCPAPLPGPFYIDLIPNVDMNKHDDSQDDNFQKIHTDFAEFFPFDILDELAKMDEKNNESWLRPGELIDSHYYKEQTERMNMIKRDIAKNTIDTAFNYIKYLKESYEAVDDPVPSGLSIMEEFPLFPDADSEYALLNGCPENAHEFVSHGNASTFIDRCSIDGEDYKCIKQSCDKNIVIEIRDKKAYWADVSYMYKLDK